MTGGFNPERLARISRVEDWHFWFYGRRLLVSRWLNKLVCPTDGKVLDAGCGTGLLLQQLRARGFRAIGLDLLPEALRQAWARNGDISLVRGVVENLPFRDSTLCLIIMLDVLEHADDRLALREAWRVLVPGGWLLVSVPAMSWLWSARDIQAGHRRRYSRHSLLERLSRAGFRPVEACYYQFFLFPLVVLARVMGRFKPEIQDLEERPGRLVNILLRLATAAEIALGRWIRWPWGSTIFVLARRSHDPTF